MQQDRIAIADIENCLAQSGYEQLIIETLS